VSRKPTPNRAKRSAIRPTVPDDGAIVLAGAGVVENAWEPVIRALNRVARCHSASAANSRLASHVSIRRSLFAKHIKVDPEVRRLREGWVVIHQQLAELIAVELAAAEAMGELSLRPSFPQFCGLYASDRPVKIISTNWDHVLEDTVRPFWPTSQNIVHYLHGDRSDPASMLFPSEMVSEPYRSMKVYRKLFERNHFIRTALSQASRLLVIGLAMSPLDSELVSNVSIAFDSGRLREVYVCDPDHATVVERLMAIRMSRRPVISGCHPLTPSELVQYGWD